MTGMQMGLSSGQELALQTSSIRDPVSFSWVAKHTLYWYLISLYLHAQAE